VKSKTSTLPTMDADFQDLIDLSQLTCDPMDIEQWGCADDAAVTIQNGQHIICE
jgi:hypothetical protein